MYMNNAKKSFRKRLFVLNIICILSIANATQSLGSIQKLFLTITKIAMICFIVVGGMDLIIKSRYSIQSYPCVILPFGMYILFRCFSNNYGFSVSSFVLVLLLYFSCIVFFQYDDAYDELLTASIIGGYVLIIYLLFSYHGITGFLRSIQFDAIANVIVQKNILAYSMAIVVLVCLFKVIYEKKLIYFILSILPICVVIGTGSRRGMIAIAVAIMALFFLKEFNTKLLFNIVISTALVYVVYWVLQRLNLGYVTERINSVVNLLFGGGGVSSSDQGRMDMIQIGLKMFREKPIWGFGADAFKHLSGYNIYSHNNYIELMTNYGLIGLTLYYSVFLKLIKDLLLLAFRGNVYSKFLLSFFIMRIVSDFGNVSYYDRFTYIMLAVGISYIRRKDYSIDETT